ncbi:MAG: DUF3391 domain-containing protein [Rhizobacter sp.]
MNSAVTSRELVEVDDLRVGMFIHLDMSWMSHPFPLGSFKIANTEQIATIRSLGVQRVRWSPTQSDSNLDTSGWGRATDFDRLESAKAEPAVEAAPMPAPDPAVAESPEAAARAQHRRALAEQRAAQQLCERQFCEAARDCKQLTDIVPSKPKEARQQAEALSKALVDKMLGDGDMCIRLLTEAAGDKA